jgi:Winged helix DNA-binding domain
MLAERLTAQLLAGPPASDAVAAVERLLAVQAQDGRAARLAVRARTRGLTAADVDSALADRSLIITWLNRFTLHLVRCEDYWWLHALTTPPLFTGSARRLAQEGVSRAAAERGVALIARALADGPLTGRQLRDRLTSAGIRTAGQAFVHIVALAGLRGSVVRGPMLGRSHAYVLTRDWLGRAPRVDRERALAELCRRYLAGHGPATDRDLAKWSGLSLGVVRSGLGAISSELDDRGGGLVDIAGRRRPAPLPPPRLLGAFEPLLLGWASRDLVLGSHEAQVVGGGMLRPVALVAGRGAATWGLQAGRVVIRPFQRLRPADTRTLEQDAEDVLRFLLLSPARSTGAEQSAR